MERFRVSGLGSRVVPKVRTRGMAHTRVAVTIVSNPYDPSCSRFESRCYDLYRRVEVLCLVKRWDG